MIKNYLKIAWRNLVKNRASSIINIGGLAVGMTAVLLIGLWIWDELSFNKYHKDYDRIAQVRTRFTDPQKNEVGINSSVQFPLYTQMKTAYRDNFKYVVMASWDVDDILAAGDKKLSRTGLFMDPEAPDMLTLKMIYGSRKGLRDPYSILLSQTTAQALFGDVNPVNQVMKLNNADNVKVTGVYEDLPLNTQFKDLKFISPTALWFIDNPWIMKSAVNDWQNHFLKIYAEIAPGKSFAQASANIKDAELKSLVNLPDEVKIKPQVFLLPMSDWHLHNYKRNKPDTGPLQMVWLVSIIGGFVLLLACINFMNLSTARSEKRAREIGVRKTMGSIRRQLIAQFYSESFLIVLVAFGIAVILASIFLQPFNALAAKELQMPFGQPLFWFFSLGFILITTVISGSYPALYLSSFKPVNVLKGVFKAGRFASVPRKVLVVMQFSISAALIVCTIIVYKQIQMAKDRPVGYTRDGLIMVEKKSSDFDGKYNILRSELKKTGVVADMAESLGKVTEVASGNGGFTWPGKDPNFNDSFATLPITFDFGKTVGWQFVQGRDFSRDFITDSTGMVINESAARYMGLKNPVGEAISWKFQDQPVKYYHILGVVRDMVMESPYEPTEPTLFMVKGHTGTTHIDIKISPRVSAGEALPKIAGVFKKIAPAVPFEYEFADDDYAAKFAAEQSIGRIAAVFASLAVFISCLGLFGLALFVAEQRIKEIGVRKIMGATVFNLWRLMSKDFVGLVIMASLIAMPVAYYFMHNWLQHYTYRTDLSWWVFAGTIAGAIVITLATVSYQSIRAATANPVKSLRSE